MVKRRQHLKITAKTRRQQRNKRRGIPTTIYENNNVGGAHRHGDIEEEYLDKCIMILINSADHHVSQHVVSQHLGGVAVASMKTIARRK